MNLLGNYPGPQHFLHSLTNVILFCPELINDFRVSLHHPQAFASKVDETIYSLESEEALMLHNEEQIFTADVVLCSEVKATNPTYLDWV